MNEPSLPVHGVGVVRLVLGVLVVPALVLGAGVMWTTSVRSRLPDPLATHWNGAGQMNGTTSFASFLTMTITLAVVLWVPGAVMVAAGSRSRVRFHYQRAAMAWCCGSSAFATGVLVLTIHANLDQRSAAEASLPAVAVLAMLGVGAVAALIGWVIAGTPPDMPALPPPSMASGQPGRAASTPAVAVLAPGEHPIWQRHLTSRPLAALTIVMLVFGFALVPVLLVAAVIVIVTALGCAPLTSLTAVVDETGLSVRFGPFGWPAKHIGLGSIAAVRADHIRPLEWGGWGYRVAPGRSAAVLRGGPGIVVDLVDGRSFAVTIDDPEGGVALLQAYRQRLDAQ